MTVSPDGKRVYVASQYDHAVVVFERTESGGLSTLEVEQDGEGGVDGLATANGLAVSPDGRHRYVAGYDDNALAILALGPLPMCP